MTPVPTVSIGLARRCDAAAVACMSRDLIERGLGWRWTPARVACSLRHRDSVVLVARRRAEIAGFAIMQFGNEFAHLSLLGVAPAQRRRGIGRRLLGWLEESANTAGILAVNLEVRIGNGTALAFYRALDYEETGVLRGYYGGRESAVRMTRILRYPPALGVIWTPPPPGAPGR